MKTFQIPSQYRSPLISAIKAARKAADRLKKDFTPTHLSLGRLELILARHFGFCYGVENAIEIAFRAVEENPGKRIFLLSEMIHNPGVNTDLKDRGVRFLMDTKGNKIMDWQELKPEDVVVIPAFGTTLELAAELRSLGIEPTQYETTCPFVEKVWNRAEKIGREGYTLVVHGKPKHEETRATFSHSSAFAKTVVVKDMAESEHLAKFITGALPPERFFQDFEGQYTPGFNPVTDLRRIGVVNQTTMLASETQGISDYLKEVMIAHYQLNPQTLHLHFADTRDTLCYATNDNQSAVQGMLSEKADLAIVIGGYNSSNTSHLVELCEEKLPTYFIRDEDCLQLDQIRHFDLHTGMETVTEGYLPATGSLKILVTSGASCPDALVERVLVRLAELTGNEAFLEATAARWLQELATENS